MSRPGKTYIVGNVNGADRIFEVRKNRLGLKTYWTMRGKAQKWTRHSGIILKKSAAVVGRAAARELLAHRKAGRVK